MRLNIIAATVGLGSVALLAGALVATGGAQAQPAGERAPFSMLPVEGGLMRLDTRTGAMSFCAQRSGGWTCEAVPDDRAALEAEIGRLQARIAALEAGRAGRASGVPDIMVPPQATLPEEAEPPAAQAPASPPPNTDEELPAQARKRLDQAMDLAEQAFRRFFEMIERFREEFPPGAGHPATPPAQGQGQEQGL